VLAPAKINMCLFLGGTRADGRHELVSVMQSLAWGDEVTAEPADRDEVVCPGVEGSNLAEAALAAVTEGRGPLRITIEKGIPIAAGLGGGSADAAAVLRLLQEEGRTPFSEVAAQLGADVPAQLRPGRALATGAGEVVEPLVPPPRFGIVVLPSEHRLSTADVYREADRLELPRSPVDLAARLDEVRAALDDGPFGLPLELLVNDLEPAALHLQPAIAGALDRLRATGTGHVMVSGSGPTVLGFYEDPAAARAAAQELPGAIATTPLDTP
jgi:4-diphosphocytidyl-2-C-methyl-D-erythritol kinase